MVGRPGISKEKGQQTRKKLSSGRTRCVTTERALTNRRLTEQANDG